MVMVNLVSPVQQSINQANDEVKRNMQGIKRRKREQTQSHQETSKEADQKREKSFKEKDTKENITNKAVAEK